MTLQGNKQIEKMITIDAPVGVVWEVLADSRLLPQWVPVVDEVNSCEADGESVGAVRSCAAALGGKEGTMVERCVEFVPNRRIAFVVDEESFGMAKMFDDYGFSLDLNPVRADQTNVTLQTHYTPKNLMYAALNVLVVRRQFTQTCQGIVDGLKTFSEATAAASG